LIFFHSVPRGQKVSEQDVDDFIDFLGDKYDFGRDNSVWAARKESIVSMLVKLGRFTRSEVTEDELEREIMRKVPMGMLYDPDAAQTSRSHDVVAEKMRERERVRAELMQEYADEGVRVVSVGQKIFWKISAKIFQERPPPPPSTPVPPIDDEEYNDFDGVQDILDEAFRVVLDEKMIMRRRFFKKRPNPPEQRYCLSFF